MLGRLLKNADASDALIAVALAGLGLAVTMKTDAWFGLGVVSAVLVGLFALSIVASR